MKSMKPDTILLRIALLAVLAVACTACQKPASTPEKPDYLIKAGETIMTPLDFKRAFEVNKTAYDYDDLKDPLFLKDVKFQFLNQMTERLPVLERARELNVWVSDEQLNREIAKIQKGYPEGAFQNELLESAISYEAWVEELRVRLLMEKLVQIDLTEKSVVTHEEIEKYRKAYAKKLKHTQKTEDRSVPEDLDTRIVRYLRRKKTEGGYKAWLDSLQKKYPIEINKDEWEKIIASGKE